jgi:hypothetical protein
VPDGVPAENLPSPAAFLGVSSGVSSGEASWLADFLAQAYIEGARPHDALELRRSQLSSQPTRAHYTKLRDTAGHLDRWADVRPWALDILRASPDDLVWSLLDDGEPDAAWEAAEKYGCSPHPWLDIARLRAEHHPVDVLPGYRALINDCAERTGRRHYREAVSLLGELRQASRRCDRLAEFGEFVAALRMRHRRKTALLNEMDQAGLC